MLGLDKQYLLGGSGVATTNPRHLRVDPGGFARPCNKDISEHFEFNQGNFPGNVGSELAQST